MRSTAKVRWLLFSALVIALAVSLITPSLGALVGEVSEEKNIEVIQGVNLYLNDHVVIPRDAQGNEVFPFIYEGTTYLPIRAITSKLGCEVEYNAGVASIARNENAEVDPGIEWRRDISPVTTTVKASTNIKINIDGQLWNPKNAQGEPVPIFVIDGTTYVPVRALCDTFHIPVVWDARNSRIYLGGHISLVDPGTYTIQDDQIKQNYCNLALVGIQQWKMDVKTLQVQFDKYQEFINEIIKTYRIVDGAYHSEAEALHATVTNNYSTILGAIQNNTDEHIQLEWDDIVNKMKFKDELSADGFAFFPKIYDSLNEKFAELNACCTDKEIAILYDKLNDIVERYKNSTEK